MVDYLGKYREVGHMAQFTGSLPIGYLPMDGVLRLKSDYPQLYTKLPASWKTANDFTLPEMVSTAVPAILSARGYTAAASLANNTEVRPDIIVNGLNFSYDPFNMLGEIDTFDCFVCPFDGIYYAWAEYEFLDTGREIGHYLEIVQCIPGNPDPPPVLGRAIMRCLNSSVSNTRLFAGCAVPMTKTWGIGLKVRQVNTDSVGITSFGHLGVTSVLVDTVSGSVGIYAGKE